MAARDFPETICFGGNVGRDARYPFLQSRVGGSPVMCAYII